MRKLLSFAALSACFVSSSFGAALLSVDFGNTTTGQTGFTGVNSSPTTIGDFTIVSSGSFYRRGGTDFALYDDFTFVNGVTSFTVTLSGVGIAANTDYDLKFWSFDSDNGSQTHNTTFAGISGTSGSAGTVTWGAPNPVTLDEFSTSGIFTSDGSGVLTIQISDTASSGGTGPRLNGLEISAVPEPGAPLLVGIGGLLLLMRRKRD